MYKRQVKTAARFCREPALERVAGLDRNAARRGRLTVRLQRFGKAGPAVDGAAVCSCIPLDRQADGRAAVITLPVAVCVGVVRIFLAGITTGRTSFRALVLRIVRF